MSTSSFNNASAGNGAQDQEKALGKNPRFNGDPQMPVGDCLRAILLPSGDDKILTRYDALMRDAGEQNPSLARAYESCLSRYLSNPNSIMMTPDESRAERHFLRDHQGSKIPDQFGELFSDLQSKTQAVLSLQYDQYREQKAKVSAPQPR